MVQFPLVAYYDASSKEEQRDTPLVVAGLVSDQESWTQLDEAWRRACDEIRVSHFHATDFHASQNEFRIFATPSEKARRRAYQTELVELACRYVACACVVSIAPADYHAANGRYRLNTDYWKGAYSVAALYATCLAENWIASERAGCPVAHVIERGDGGQGPLADMAAKMGLGSPLALIPKRDVGTGEQIYPFDVCDLVASHHRRAMAQAHGDRERNWPFIQLSTRIPTRSLRIDLAALTRMCEGMPEDYPKR